MKTLITATLMSATALAAIPAQAGTVEDFLGEPIATAKDAATINARCEMVMTELERRLGALEKEKGTATVANTLKPYDELIGLLYAAGGEFVVYREVMLDAERREAAGNCESRIDNFDSTISLSRPLYDRLKGVDVSGEDEKTQYYLSQILEAFDRNGVSQDAEGRAKIAALQEEITKAGTDFDRNIAESTGSIKALPEELAGLPQDFIDAHPVGPDGLVTLTTASPDVTPVLAYAESERLRERLMRVYYSRAYPENQEALRRLINKRDELAKALGRENYAALALEPRMIDTPAKAEAQIEQVAAAALPAAEADIALKKEVLAELKPGVELDIFNTSYVATQVMKDRFDLDPQEVRQYFTYDNVRDGVFRLVEDLFQVEIVPWDTDVWHEDVETFEIRDRGQVREAGTVLGRFYLDSHPRDGKYSHANHVTMRDGVGDAPAVSALVMNMPKGGYDTGLMEHGDVETFLHEFGHLIHNILGGNQRWYGQAGVATERDFVEAPSQMLENWVYDYDTLARFAKNEAGETIPHELVEKMQAARYFGRGQYERRQAGYSNASLNYYRGPAPEDLSEAYRTWVNEYSMLPFPEGTHSEGRFGHLNGYSAGYYTYGWSRVIAADLFTRFKTAGLRDPQTAMDYRVKVLGAGGTRPAAELVEDFLGRPVSFEAFSEEVAQGTKKD
ncbi:M3 family metallopeptidase [Croceicoccus gelatinilyticus]|uniref:M3 family metallopeptidase n=1 Tax=Croceicoccus gelatinilyticus TaxID=2835536 RepID=UPI001BCCAFDF|nr:M3 family metallopeptidase [Croceicoccus gelatinilyticus]MBS7668780.1 Zn-dependent oligopeptidase [Croceicoccus gelatinilyticus]